MLIRRWLVVRKTCPHEQANYIKSFLCCSLQPVYFRGSIDQSLSFNTEQLTRSSFFHLRNISELILILIVCGQSRILRQDDSLGPTDGLTLPVQFNLFTGYLLHRESSLKVSLLLTEHYTIRLLHMWLNYFTLTHQLALLGQITYICCLSNALAVRPLAFQLIKFEWFIDR